MISYFLGWWRFCFFLHSFLFMGGGMVCVCGQSRGFHSRTRRYEEFDGIVFGKERGEEDLVLGTEWGS